MCDTRATYRAEVAVDEQSQLDELVRLAANAEIGLEIYEPIDNAQVALERIAAMVPKEDQWRSSADFMEATASILDQAGIKRPERYEDEE